MNKEYLKAYGALVTANGMFESISHFPLHHSFNSYNAIDSMFINNTNMTAKEYEEKKIINEAYQLMLLSSHLGVALTNDLAIAFEKDEIAQFNSYSVIKPKLERILYTLNKQELEDIINFATHLKTIKD